MSSNKDILQKLAEKLETALDEVSQIKDTLLSSPEADRVRGDLERGARAFGGEASRIFERLGRDTYELVKAGRATVPDAIRETFEWAERSLSRFADSPPQDGDAPAARSPSPAAKTDPDDTREPAAGPLAPPTEDVVAAPEAPVPPPTGEDAGSAEAAVRHEQENASRKGGGQKSG